MWQSDSLALPTLLSLGISLVIATFSIIHGVSIEGDLR